MDDKPKVPRSYGAFLREFPKLGDAWEAMREAEENGPYGRRELRLLKLAIAIGTQKEGPVHSGVRKALAAGCSAKEIRHLVALAASTIGLPPAVAVWSWIDEELEKSSAAAEKPGKGSRPA